MLKKIALLSLVGMLAACDKNVNVVSQFRIDNQTNYDLQCHVALSYCGECGINTEIPAYQKKTITQRNGVRGVYMIEYLFERCQVFFTDSTDSPAQAIISEQFADPNFWDDFLESEAFRTYGGDQWSDTCTFVITQQMLEEMRVPPNSQDQP